MTSSVIVPSFFRLREPANIKMLHWIFLLISSLWLTLIWLEMLLVPFLIVISLTLYLGSRIPTESSMTLRSAEGRLSSKLCCNQRVEWLLTRCMMWLSYYLDPLILYSLMELLPGRHGVSPFSLGLLKFLSDCLPPLISTWAQSQLTGFLIPVTYLWPTSACWLQNNSYHNILIINEDVGSRSISQNTD